MIGWIIGIVVVLLIVCWVIGTYNGLIKGATTDDVSYPFLTELLNDSCILCSYIWGYVIINNYLVNKKIKKIYLFLYILGITVSLVSGSRGDALGIIFSTVCIAILAFRKTEGKRKIPKKYYFYIMLAFVAMIATFQIAGTSMGRDSNIFTPFEYISIYLGAPILNLDIMIKKVGGGNTVFFNYTFSGLYTSLGRVFGITKWTKFKDPMVHLASNGHRTGNVATTFMAYYYDAGVIGVFLLTALMSIFMQKLYEKCRKDDTMNISYKMIFYSYFLFLTARSFFSNSLFNAVQISLIKMILIILVEAKFIDKIRLKKDTF